MKALSKSVKAVLAASALAASGASQATVWNVDMSANVFFAAANGPLQMIGFTGTWDDVAGTGTWTGTTTIANFKTTMHYTQTFSMDETTGQGTLNSLDLGTCTDNTGSACTGLAGPLAGAFRNTVVNPPTPSSYKKALPFTPADGWTGQWTLQVNKAITNPDGSTAVVYLPMPMDVTLHAQAPAVPVPAAVWLFGSGLLGLAGTARRRRSSAT